MGTITAHKQSTEVYIMCDLPRHGIERGERGYVDGYVMGRDYSCTVYAILVFPDKKKVCCVSIDDIEPTTT